MTMLDSRRTTERSVTTAFFIKGVSSPPLGNCRQQKGVRMRTTSVSRLARVVGSIGVVISLSVVLFLLAARPAFAQPAASHVSSVGTWKADLKESKFGGEEVPKSLTLTITKDTPQLLAWRVDVVDAKGQAMSYSWSGPQDGTMQSIKGPDGKEVGKESFKDEKGVLVRRGDGGKEGPSFESHVTMSADGNTMTDVITGKSKDGKSMSQTVVWRRAPTAKKASF
jgi:hypothetical protein